MIRRYRQISGCLERKTDLNGMYNGGGPVENHAQGTILGCAAQLIRMKMEGLSGPCQQDQRQAKSGDPAKNGPSARLLDAHSTTLDA